MEYIKVKEFLKNVRALDSDCFFVVDADGTYRIVKGMYFIVDDDGNRSIEIRLEE